MDDQSSRRLIWPPADYPQTNAFGQALRRWYHLAYKAPTDPIALYDTQLFPWVRRKSYRQLVRWGQEHMHLNRMSGDQLRVDDGHVERLHRQVAGRTTRLQKTWDIMWDEIKKGRGELVTGTLQHRVVSATIFIDGDDCSVYWTGIYDREAMLHSPIAHYPVMAAIGGASLRGRRWVELGEMPRGENCKVGDKAYNIGFFKQGFATDVIDPQFNPPKYLRLVKR